MAKWLEHEWYKLIAIVALLGATGHFPYAYYQATRWIVVSAAFYCAYRFHKEKKDLGVVVMVVIGVLFNPVWPIFLSKSTWHYIDIAAAAVFFILLFPEAKWKSLFERKKQADDPDEEMKEYTRYMRRHAWKERARLGLMLLFIAAVVWSVVSEIRSGNISDACDWDGCGYYQ